MDDAGSGPTVDATATALETAGYRRREPPTRGVALVEPAGRDDDRIGRSSDRSATASNDGRVVESNDDFLHGLTVRGDLDAGDSRPIEVVATDGDPVRVTTALGNARKRGRDVLFVPDGPEPERSADRVVGVLSDPVGAKAVDADGYRTLYPGPDRVHLAEGGLAAVGTDDLGPGPARSIDFEWFEEPADRSGDASGADGHDDRTGSDDQRLVLEADGHAVAVVDGVDELSCPGPDRAAVPFYYRRGDDRLFHVFRSDGSPVGVFDGVRRMRRQGFVPIPAPLVPERELSGSPAGHWGVVTGIQGGSDPA